MGKYALGTFCQQGPDALGLLPDPTVRTSSGETETSEEAGKLVAIARDTLGHIFSGSSIVDQENVAGYGAGSILAYYTSASDKNGQIQCLAYSKDNGRTFTKYEKNPVLRPSDGLKDFRDPKVFWYAPESKWVMIVSADKEMRFYDSHNLKDWNYLSSFGEGYGVQPCQFECPDMVELPVDGDINHKK